MDPLKGTLFKIKDSGLDVYLSSSVVVCGSKKVTQTAQNIVASTDELVSLIEKLIKEKAK